VSIGWTIRANRSPRHLDGVRHQVDLMEFCNSITAKVLVWLAAILVPVEALPLGACDCGSPSPQSATLKSGLADAAPAAKCPHCAARLRAQHSCCGGTAVSSAEHKCCCCGDGPCHCSCKGKMGSHGSPCQCAANKSAPAPAPLPSNSRTDNTKSSLGSSSDTTVAVVISSVVLASAAQQPSLLACTSLERLNTLCRLVI
jgi:hypothetical protein